MRRLIFTTGSPFARAVRIVLDEKGLAWEPQEEITTPTVEARAKTSPTLQVPTLIDGDLRLWDSSVILDYLTTPIPAAMFPARPTATPTSSSVRTTRGSTSWRSRRCRRWASARPSFPNSNGPA